MAKLCLRRERKKKQKKHEQRADSTTSPPRTASRGRVAAHGLVSPAPAVKVCISRVSPTRAGGFLHTDSRAALAFFGSRAGFAGCCCALHHESTASLRVVLLRVVLCAVPICIV